MIHSPYWAPQGRLRFFTRRLALPPTERKYRERKDGCRKREKNFGGRG
jgi:hypothetical protein